MVKKTSVIMILISVFLTLNDCESLHSAFEYASDLEQIQKIATEWENMLADVESALRELPPLPGWTGLTLAEARRLKQRMEETVRAVKSARYVSLYTIALIDKNLRRLSVLTDNVSAVAHAQKRGDRYVVFAPEAVSDIKILPNTFPVPGNAADSLRVTMCRGEYESASLALLALQEVNGLEVSVTDLVGPGVIARNEIEAYIVKCWWQAGYAVYDSINKTLVPELLLKDDDLVRVDLDRQENRVRSTGADGTTEYRTASGRNSEHLADLRPRDADRLLPFSIPERQTRQLWFTVHAPENARPGDYEGFIDLKGPEDLKRIKLKVTVYPFDLEPGPLIYSIYYRGVLSQEGSVTSEAKSEKQYLAEMRDLKAHGVLYPTLYQEMSTDLFPRALELRAQAGLPARILFALRLPMGNPGTELELVRLSQNVQAWRSLIKMYGYDELYLYGIDEAWGEQLRSQRQTWTVAREAGARIFAACFRGAFERVGDLLDLAVVFGQPDPAEAEKYHGRGNKIFCYAYPQVGQETPETYRRNFGLLLWKAGYDGAMNYAYQHGFNNIWNDFDYFPWRDHNFTYPTVDGIVGTRQWEGFREAVDDVRYIATLEKAIAMASPKKPEIALQAKTWLEKINPAGDLGRMREKICEWILLLRA